MLKEFDPGYFSGVVLDESSILKAFTGKTKRMLLDMFDATPYRLACTATPAPNDHLEFGNHAEFLGIMDSNKMISRWFINDTMAAGNYRLKKHAASDFWRWMTTWSVCMSKPSDLGQYSDDGFILPGLHLHEAIVDVDHTRAFEKGQLFLTESLSATGMWAEKRRTSADRCQMARYIFDENNQDSDYWIVWCDTNDEADQLKKLFPDAVEVRGSDTIPEKERKLELFSDGQVSMIITKPDIAGFGLNWQHAAKMMFVGVTYSFEKTYQALHRSLRFGQKNEVNAWMIYAETEGNITKTLKDKEEKHKEMQEQMNAAQEIYGLDGLRQTRTAPIDTGQDVAKGKNFTLYLGDSVLVMNGLEKESVDLSIFSPPFSNLYVYTDTPADMGNNEDHEQFFIHFRYIIENLWRITKPGRLCVVHCKDLPLYMNRDGAAGLYDFPGRLVQEFENGRFGGDNNRWVYHSRVTIWKDPVIEMQRTKNHGLLWRNFSDRGEVVRQGMPDYLLVFRKWIDLDQMPDKQVSNIPSEYIGTEAPERWDSQRDYSIQVWQKYASPVWYDINQTRVLNVRLSRDGEDEKHICPLQLDVIARCVEIWSNPGDIVFSPFAGIGSEGYEAIKRKRKFVGIELKDRYWEIATDNLKRAEVEISTPTLFDLMPISESA
jgi:DNA modification methylase